MRVNLVSDLHLNFADLVLPGGDVLVMAGDIMEAGHLRRADNAKKIRSLLIGIGALSAKNYPSTIR